MGTVRSCVMFVLEVLSGYNSHLVSIRVELRTLFFTKNIASLGLTLALALLFSHNVFAADLPAQEIVPGGIAILPIATATDKQPQAEYNGKPVMVIKNQNQWYAVVGIALVATPGQQNIKVTLADGSSRTLEFTVQEKAYETQHLTIADQRKVEPNEEDMKRINQEKVETDKALAHWNDTLLTQSLYLDLPVEGKLSSSFGLRRFFNEQPRAPHSGLDITAPAGTPIKAPAAGRVILIGDFFFNGNGLFIDHGQGLVTMYCHMSRIDVKEGQEVKRGQIIGAVGMTGRATGPHLHWGVSLNDARVNPSLFVPALMNNAVTSGSDNKPIQKP